VSSILLEDGNPGLWREKIPTEAHIFSRGGDPHNHARAEPTNGKFVASMSVLLSSRILASVRGFVDGQCRGAHQAMSDKTGPLMRKSRIAFVLIGSPPRAIFSKSRVRVDGILRNLPCSIARMGHQPKLGIGRKIVVAFVDNKTFERES
jgi:hypothetical protein